MEIVVLIAVPTDGTQISQVFSVLNVQMDALTVMGLFSLNVLLVKLSILASIILFMELPPVIRIVPATNIKLTPSINVSYVALIVKRVKLKQITARVVVSHL